MGRELAVGAETLERQLAEYVRDVLGDDRPLTLGERLSGGWSVDTFRVELGDQSLVLRIANEEHPLDTSPAREAQLFVAAAEARVPVPLVLAAEEDESWLGGSFALCSFVPGAAPNVWNRRRIDALLARVSAEDLVRHLAELSLRIRDMPVALADKPASNLGIAAQDYTVAADVERWLERLRRTIVERPALDLAGRWLAGNAPEPDEVVLQHHDFRLGNVLFTDDGTPTAVLDWEFCGAGDPLCDIGYAAQPYTLGRLLSAPVRLRLEPDPTTAMLRIYADACERPPELGRMRYFVALGIFKMAIALAITADEWWSGRGGRRDAWLELPILSLTDDLIKAIKEMP